MFQGILTSAKVGHKHHQVSLLSRLLVAFALLSLTAIGLAQTATITPLGANFKAYALSRNGKVVVGQDTSTGEAAYWSNGTVTDIPGANNPSVAYSCNEDGSIIVGERNGLPFIYNYDNFAPALNLPLLSGTSTGSAVLISANGLSIAGYCDGNPVVWGIGGVEAINTGSTSTALNAISDDGTTIACDTVGNYSTQTVPSTNTIQHPGVISLGNIGQAPLLTFLIPFLTSVSPPVTGFEDLFCLTSDGSTLYGGAYDVYNETFTGIDNQTYTNPETHGFVTAVFSDANQVNSQLGNFTIFEAHSCNADGSVLAGDQIFTGSNTDGFGNSFFSGFSFGGFTDIAFGGNVQDLQSFLTGKGASFPFGYYEDGVSTQAMSGDGSVILGIMTPDNTLQENYLATISPAISSLNPDVDSFVGGSFVQLTVGLDYPAPPNTTVSITSDTPAVIPNTSAAVARGTMLGATTITSASVSRITYVNLTATLGSASLSTLVVVQPLLPSITEIYPSAGTVVGGNSILGYVDLSFAAGASGDSVSLASDNANVQVQPTVAVGANATAASFSITSTPVTAVTKATITATLGNSTESTVVTVVPPTVTLVRMGDTSLIGGTSTKVAVYLNGMAPTGGLAVNVLSSSPSVVVPATITVLSGATAANATVTTSAVTTSTSVTIKAVTGSIAVTTNLLVTPVVYPAITEFYPSVSSITGGNGLLGYVRISAAAGTSGVVVALSSNTAGVTVPATVKVLSGATLASFSISSSPVAATYTATLKATLGSAIEYTVVTVVPAVVTVVRVSPSPVVGGVSTKVAVYLIGKAPTGGQLVNVASSSPSAVVPASITVPAGAMVANATVTTSPVASATPIIVTAKTGTTSVQTTLILLPPSVIQVKVAPSPIVGGVSAKVAVYLNEPAPVGGFVVNLVSNNACVQVPAAITVPAGATAANAPMTTSKVASATTVTITATTGTASATTTLVVDP